MKVFREYLPRALVAGLIVVVPLYLAVLLILKAMGSLAGLVKPVAALLPEWMPAVQLMSLLLVLLLCLVVGMIVQTSWGRAVRERLERLLFERIPGYALLRSLTQRLAGKSNDKEDVWKPALVEIEDALVPAFIIETLDDGRCTVFVPSVPTPLAGAIYILAGERVHPLDVPFTQALKVISRWGHGAKELVAGMEPGRNR